MSVEATLRDAFRLAESYNKRADGPSYKSREAGFERQADGTKKWNGPDSYKIGQVYLRPWEYVDVIHHMNQIGWRRGLVTYLHFLIDQHVPKVAQRPINAGIPRGLTKEQRKKIMEAREGGVWDRSREEKAEEDADEENQPRPITGTGALLRKRASKAPRIRTDAERVSASVAARRPKQKQAGRLRANAPIPVRFVSR